MTRRLYLKIYFTFVVVALLALVAAAFGAHLFEHLGGPPLRNLAPVARALLRDGLSARPPDLRQRLREVAEELDLDVAVWDGQGRELARASRSPFPAPRRLEAGWTHSAGGPALVLPLAGERFLGVRERGRFAHRRTLFLALLGLVAVVMAAGLFPLSRGITRRLEQLAEGARRFGAGELGHRVPVEGRDEIATVAARFNQAASALEALVDQQRQMLATASHELRSPLARLRMAVELLAEEADGERRRRLADKAHEDIVDLDGLVEDVLVMARAQPGVPRRPFTPVDLLALVTAEAERAGAAVDGEPVSLEGDAAMLRHLARNLLSNARVHGGGAEVRAELRRRGGQVVFAVEDRGPGIPEAEREKIFAPFYRLPGARGAGDAGVGLGLALVRQVARYHGGEVVHAARPGGGSRFEVTLPLHGGAARLPDPVPAG